jgi:hypothetical protein
MTHKNHTKARAAVLLILSVMRAVDMIGIRQIILSGYQYFILTPLPLASSFKAAAEAYKAQTALQSRGKLVLIGLSSIQDLRSWAFDFPTWRKRTMNLYHGFMRVLGPAVWLELWKYSALTIKNGWALVAMYQPDLVAPPYLKEYFED